MTKTYIDNTLMDAADAEAWIARLETAKKGKRCLWDADGCACCLGVKADMEGAWDDEVDCDGRRTIDGSWSYIATRRLSAWGIPEPVAVGLAALNDCSDTFTPVIAEIRRLFITERDATAAKYGWTA